MATAILALGPLEVQASQGFTIPSHTTMAKICANPRNFVEKVSELVPGKMLVLEGGEYDLTEPLRITNRIGSATSPMVIRPRGWGESANVLISSSDRVTFTGRAIEFLNCRYLAVQGIVFETDVAQDHRVVYMNRCSHCRITQCTFLPVETNMPTSEWASWIYCKQLDDYGDNHFFNTYYGIHVCSGNGVAEPGGNCLGVKPIGLHPKVNGCTIHHNKIQATRYHVLYGGYPGRETPYGGYIFQPDDIIDQHNDYYGAGNPRGLEIGSPPPTWFFGTSPGVFNDPRDEAVNHIDETPKDVWFEDDLRYFDRIKDSSGVRVSSAAP